VGTPRPMTAREEAFCREYLSGATVTASAITAGYAPRSAASQGSRLLKRAKIQGFLNTARAAARDQGCLSLETARRIASAIALDPRQRAMPRLAAIQVLSRLCNWDSPPPAPGERTIVQVVFSDGSETDILDTAPDGPGGLEGATRPVDPSTASPPLPEASQASPVPPASILDSIASPSTLRPRSTIPLLTRPARRVF